jgi:hypothetical protein
MFRRRRKPQTPQDLFHERWIAWWEDSGRRGVIRLLAEHECPSDAGFNGPHWPEAEAIGDAARFGGVNAEDVAAYLSAFAEDLGAVPDAQRDAAAARAIADYLDGHAPTLRR